MKRLINSKSDYVKGVFRKLLERIWRVFQRKPLSQEQIDRIKDYLRQLEEEDDL